MDPLTDTKRKTPSRSRDDCGDSVVGPKDKLSGRFLDTGDEKEIDLSKHDPRLPLPQAVLGARMGQTVRIKIKHRTRRFKIDRIQKG